MTRSPRIAALLGALAALWTAPACQDDTGQPGAPPSGDGGAVGSPAPGAGTSGDRSDGGALFEDGGPRPAAGDGGAKDAEPAPYVHFQINHVLSTGQSNAVANDGKPVLSTTQPYLNLMFDTGVMTGGSCDGDGCSSYQTPTKLVPLVEGDTFFYPVETMSSGLANLVAELARGRNATRLHVTGEPHPVLVSLHGRSGNSYGCLRKGGCDWWPDKSYIKPFDEAMRQVRDARALAAAAGKTYAVRAVTAIHGEHDHYDYEAGTSAFPMPGTDATSTIRSYADALVEWQRDYEAGVKAITGQTVPVPLFLNQYSHWNNVPTTKVAYMQLEAHLRAPDKVIVVGPTYALPYTNGCLHFTNHGERQLGEYFAKAYTRTVLDGRRWEPLRPTAVSIAGNVVTARFHVPVPPLTFDTKLVDDPGHFGFEWYDASGAPPAITKVTITAPDTVQITLAAAPTGADRRLRYAYTFKGCAGPRTLARGNLRDSDTTASLGGYDLFNWAVHFDAPIP